MQGQDELSFMFLAKARKGYLYTCTLRAVSSGEEGKGEPKGNQQQRIVVRYSTASARVMRSSHVAGKVSS